MSPVWPNKRVDFARRFLRSLNSQTARPFVRDSFAALGEKAMRIVIRPLLVCALCASSAVGRAESIEQTFQFDCDVPAGKMSEWIGTIVPRLQHVEGSVELLEPRTHERWLPVASIFLFQGTQKVGLQLYRDRQQQDKLQVAVLRPESEGGRSVIASVPWEGAPIAFSLLTKQSGDVELAVAGKVALLGAKDIDVEKLALSCSSAQFEFKNVVVRSEGAQQSVAADRREDAAPAER